MATAIGAYATATDVKLRAGISDSTDDTLIGDLCDQVNSFIESTTGRILAPISGTAVLLYDGSGSHELYLPVTADATYPYIGGIRAITTLEIAEYTGADFTTIDAGDYFLRGHVLPGAPADILYLSDRPAGSYGYFPKGYANVRITTAAAGWSAIPDDVTEVAVTIAIRAWAARQAGQSDIVGTDEFGRPVISRYVSGRDRDTLRRYTLPEFLL